MSRRINHAQYQKRVLDNPEVPCRDGDISRSIRQLKVRAARLGTLSALKKRKFEPSVQGRRRFKRKRALKKYMTKLNKGRR